jgi:hypothetical protein
MHGVYRAFPAARNAERLAGTRHGACPPRPWYGGRLCNQEVPAVLRVIGYWDGPAAPDGLPDVCGFAGRADPAVRQAVVAYLRSGTVLAVAAGVSRCRLCGIANGSAELTDGTRFVWPEGLAHYVEAHGVRLPDEVAAVAARGPAPTVDPAPLFDASTDLSWWCGQAAAAPATVHLLGCRHSGRTAPWDLPTTADVYVDRVPDGAVATLGRLRTLLGASWPISDLRRMLTTQPFLAVAGGNPAALHQALRGSAPLRPYLFHRTPAGLEAIWSDEHAGS